MGYGFATTVAFEPKVANGFREPFQSIYQGIDNVARLIDAAFRLSLVRKLTGYTVARPLAIASLSTALFFILHYTSYDTIQRNVQHPQPVVILSGIATFMLIFRTNLAYQRYWVARTGLQRAYSCWSDYVIQAVYMMKVKQGGSAVHGQSAEVRAFEEEIMHYVSLLFAVMLQVLRGDHDLRNVMEFDRALAEKLFLKEVQNIWLITPPLKSWVKSFLLLFSSRKYARMLKRHNKRFKVFALGGMSAAEKAFLGAPLFSHPQDAPEEVSPTVRGFDKHGETFVVSAARVPRGRVFLAYSQVKQHYVKYLPGGERQLDSLLIQGFDGYESASMVIDSAFPLLWDAALSLTIKFTVFLLPVVVVRYCSLVPLAAVINFLTVFSYILVQDVAMAMENPFSTNACSFITASLSYLFIDRILYALSAPLLGANHIALHPEVVAMRSRLSNPWDAAGEADGSSGRAPEAAQPEGEQAGEPSKGGAVAADSQSVSDESEEGPSDHYVMYMHG